MFESWFPNVRFDFFSNVRNQKKKKTILKVVCYGACVVQQIPSPNISQECHQI